MRTPLLVIFDMDGTLVDSKHLIVAAMQSAFDAEGLHAPTRAQTLSVVGLSLDKAMEQLTNTDAAQRARLVEAYKGAFFDLRQAPDHYEPLFDGARKALDILHRRDDVLLGIATGKSRRGVAFVLDHHGLEDHFDTVQTADDHPSKPHPSMVRTALSETGMKAARTVVVGDTVFDIEMARAAGARPHEFGAALIDLAHRLAPL